MPPAVMVSPFRTVSVPASDCPLVAVYAIVVRPFPTTRKSETPLERTCESKKYKAVTRRTRKKT